MAKTAQIERQVKPDDNINWLTAPAVPVKVMRMSHPAGVIIVGSGGQKTYKGPIRELSSADDNWRQEYRDSQID